MVKNATGMNAYQNAAKSEGYSQTPTPGAPSYSEAWALVEAARRMAAAIETYSQAEDPSAPNARELLREPLRLNWRLWTIFQAELINSMDDPNSPMPVEIRTNMLTLCQFVDKHTTQALADPKPELLAMLIDLNRNIASGLLETPESAKTGDEQAASPVGGQAPSTSENGAAPQPPVTGGFSEEI